MSGSRPPLDWDVLESLFEAALARPVEDRLQFLERECPDLVLRSELESLLAEADPAERVFDAMAASIEALTDQLGRSYSTDAEEGAAWGDAEQGAGQAEAPQGPGVQSAPDRLIGKRVGHYRIEERLGSGGMGVVYRARDTLLEREVALKFLPPHLGLDPDAKERFRIEAKAAAALYHPSICTVYEIGEAEDGRLFIAMACYEGETLQERISRGPLPVTDAVVIASCIARGLAAAHARGVVHRDVKPGNVILTADGGVKLLDFGVAKMADVTLTGSGVTPGTVAYMSPEQVRGESVDAPSDLWSLGVVLYEMLAGRPPFRGEHDAVVLHAIRHEDPQPVGDLRPETPDHLAATVGRMLAKDPAARYPNAEELLADLGSPGSAPSRTRRAGALLRRQGGLAAAAAAATVGVTALLAAGMPWLSEGTEDPPAPTGVVPARERTVAVLPFLDLSPQPGQEYFSDGLTEELIAALARVEDLRVVARTSAFAFRGEERDIREIGRTLNAAAVVEGSVRMEGDRIRVAAQLIDASNGLSLWSDSYDRQFTDVFEIQEDLALSIAEGLQARLTPAERVRLARWPTENLDAYNNYLKGRYFWNRRTDEGFATAIDYFERAIEADPNYARAYAGLAVVLGPAEELGYMRPVEAHERMGAAVRRALDLDDGLAEVQTAQGLYLGIHSWNWEGGERAFLRAIALDPEYAGPHHFYGYLLKALGRFEEANAQRAQAVALEPLTPVMTSGLGDTYRHLGRLDLAMQYSTAALELAPGFWLAHESIGKIHEMRGELEEAALAFERASSYAGPTPRPRANLARVLALGGRAEEARRILDELRAEAAAEADIYYPEVATVFEALGDAAGAFEWLERSYEQRHSRLMHLGVDPSFDRLRDDRRFEALLERIGPRD